MDDWTECDISQIPAERFPVYCERCGYALTGLSDEGVCPECGQAFARRQRLWEIHGPEAFDEAAAGESAPSGTERADLPDAIIVVVTLVLIALFPLILFASEAIFGVVDLCVCGSAWLVAVVAADWLILRRWYEHAESKRSEAGASNHTEGESGGLRR